MHGGYVNVIVIVMAVTKQSHLWNAQFDKSEKAMLKIDASPSSRRLERLGRFRRSRILPQIGGELSKQAGSKGEQESGVNTPKTGKYIQGWKANRRK